jgi:hypothetical protein
MLWILHTGAQWENLPRRYGSKSTCHRRFQEWVETGVFEEILTALADDLEERGGIDLSECFVDATFESAKRGTSGLPGVGKAAKSWQWQTALVFLSPLTLRLLGQRRSRLLKRYSPVAMSVLSPSG